MLTRPAAADVVDPDGPAGDGKGSPATMNGRSTDSARVVHNWIGGPVRGVEKVGEAGAAGAGAPAPNGDEEGRECSSRRLLCHPPPPPPEEEEEGVTLGRTPPEPMATPSSKASCGMGEDAAELPSLSAAPISLAVKLERRGDDKGNAISLMTVVSEIALPSRRRQEGKKGRGGGGGSRVKNK